MRENLMVNMNIIDRQPRKHVDKFTLIPVVLASQNNPKYNNISK